MALVWVCDRDEREMVLSICLGLALRCRVIWEGGAEITVKLSLPPFTEVA